MNAPVTVEQTEIQKIEEALDALLTAILEQDRKPRPSREKTFNFLSVGDLVRGALESVARTKEERFAHDLFHNPVREALCVAVRRLGKRLHEIGGLQAMRDACDRVGDRDGDNWGRRVSVMDARWDGIGRVDGAAGWCS